VFDSVEACLQAPARAVLIATPSPSHVELSARALRMGRHVLCEKPVAVRSSQVRELAEAEALGGARLAGASVCRHRADVRRFLSWAVTLDGVEELELAWIRQRGVPSPGSWRTQEGGGMTGVLADLGYHLLDLAVAVMGTEPTWSCTRARRGSTGAGSGAAWFGVPSASGRYEVDDRVEAELRFQGTRLAMRASWIDSEPGDLTSLRASSPSGTVELVGLFGYSDQRRVAEQVCTRSSGGHQDSVRFEPGPGLHSAAFQPMLSEFADVCRGAEPGVGLKELRATVQMIEAIVAAAERA
jgi:predicted dehydrogenase